VALDATVVLAAVVHLATATLTAAVALGAMNIDVEPTAVLAAVAALSHLTLATTGARCEIETRAMNVDAVPAGILTRVAILILAATTVAGISRGRLSETRNSWIARRRNSRRRLEERKGACRPRSI
jgi:hypothetical protein